MEMSTEIGILLAYAFGIFALYVVGYMFLVPIKILLRLALNSVLGGLLIILINFGGIPWDIHIPLNVLTAIIVGILGIPGAIVLAII
ncbi:MAG: pro-sigmaK processing inhibitor BofA family protein [Anaerovoracaceae bacterium]|jgi:inhibitor of the pro-sigma K processing machinery